MRCSVGLRAIRSRPRYSSSEATSCTNSSTGQSRQYREARCGTDRSPEGSSTTMSRSEPAVRYGVRTLPPSAAHRAWENSSATRSCASSTAFGSMPSSLSGSPQPRDNDCYELLIAIGRILGELEATGDLQGGEAVRGRPDTSSSVNSSRALQAVPAQHRQRDLDRPLPDGGHL